MSRFAFALATLLATAPAAALADGVPFWQRLLRWSSGDSSDTPVATTMMGKHMQMSVRQPARPGDAARAEAILGSARRVLERYRDVAEAERDGYRPFAPRGVVGEEVHYTHLWAAGREVRTFDPERPGSILYRRTATGMEAVGVMYSARGDAGPEELDARLPLSIAVWHRHVHFCGWPKRHGARRLRRSRGPLRRRLDRHRGRLPRRGGLLGTARVRLDDPCLSERERRREGSGWASMRCSCPGPRARLPRATPVTRHPH